MTERLTRINTENRYFVIEGQYTGTTENAYVTVKSIDTRRLKKLGLVLKNTGADSLHIKITTRVYYGGTVDFEEVAETTITTLSTLRYFEMNFVSEIIVQVKSAALGTPTTYTLEYVGMEI